jgi:hypothetical protein
MYAVPGYQMPPPNIPPNMMRPDYYGGPSGPMQYQQYGYDDDSSYRGGRGRGRNARGGRGTNRNNYNNKNAIAARGGAGGRFTNDATQTEQTPQVPAQENGDSQAPTAPVENAAPSTDKPQSGDVRPEQQTT